MRASLGSLALLLLVPLSGCLQGDPATTTSFSPSCPNWTVAQHPLSALVDTTLYQAKTPGQTTRTNTDTFPLTSGSGPAKPPADEGGKKADRYTLTFPATNHGPILVENGTLTFRVYRNDTGQQLAFTDANHPDQQKMEVSFTAAGAPAVAAGAYIVSLVPPTQDPKPAALRFDATFTALPGYTIGTGSGGTSRAGASYSVEPTVSYRAMGCVQPLK